MANYNGQDHYGGQEWVSDEAIDELGMFDPKAGVYLFTTESGRKVYSNSDGSGLGVGGAGSKKTSGWIIPMIVEAIRNRQPFNFFINDIRSEIAPQLGPICAQYGVALYTINFSRNPWSPNHTTNTWDYIKAGPDLSATCTEAVQDAITIGTGSNGQENWWEVDACYQFALPMMMFLVLRDGGVNPRSFIKLLRVILGDPDELGRQLDLMLATGEPLVTQGARYLMKVMDDGRESFSAPFSKLTSTFVGGNFEYYADAVSGVGDSSFDMDVLAGEKPCIVCAQPTFEHLPQLAVFMRGLVGRAIRARTQNPNGRRLVIAIDEASQLGSFSRIPALVTYLRTLITTILCYQEFQQIAVAFGDRKYQEILGAIQYILATSIGSEPSARMISTRIGNETRGYINEADQQRAQSDKETAYNKALRGEVSLEETAAIMKHLDKAAVHEQTVSRALADTAEVMAFKGVYAFAARLFRGAAKGQFVSSFDDRSMNGLLGANPFYGEKVRMVGAFGKPKMVSMEECEPPPEIASLPQFQQGFKLRYPRGYYPTKARLLKQETARWTRKIFKK